MPTSGAGARVAEWIVNTDRRTIPATAMAAAARGCFDCVGVMLAAAADPVGRRMRDYVVAQGATGPCSIVGTERRTAASLAALANGTAAHALEFDDITGFGHPSAVIVPSLLALAESASGPSTGADVVTAYVIGLEVGLAFFRGGTRRERYAQMARGFHATGLFGRIAAAAAGARLRGLDTSQTQMALGIVVSTASGLVANFGTMTKPLHAGFAARDAVQAVELAAAGWTASAEAFESPVGLMRAVYGDSSASVDEIAAALGKPFVTAIALACKVHPTCGFAVPAIEGLLHLVKENGLSLDDVESVEIERSTVSPEVLLYDWPRDGHEARFSVRYGVAAALAFGRVDLTVFEDASRRDPHLTAAFGRVRLVDGPPRPDGATMLRVRTRGGRMLERATAMRGVAGSYYNPLPDADLRAKFEANARRALPVDRVAAAADAWVSLADASDVREAVRTVC
jgi:2-methylcitrate dehydratase PrpD